MQTANTGWRGYDFRVFLCHRQRLQRPSRPNICMTGESSQIHLGISIHDASCCLLCLKLPSFIYVYTRGRFAFALLASVHRNGIYRSISPSTTTRIPQLVQSKLYTKAAYSIPMILQMHEGWKMFHFKMKTKKILFQA